MTVNNAGSIETELHVTSVMCGDVRVKHYIIQAGIPAFGWFTSAEEGPSPSGSITLNE